MDDQTLRQQSLWLDTLPAPLQRWEPLESDIEQDVVIVGGGYTGLWTAYYLSQQEPELRIAVLEAERIGFGASGRNGGWCVGTMAGMAHYEENANGQARLQRALFDTVRHMEEVCRHEQIDCNWHRGGWLSLALSRTQAQTQQALVAEWQGQGFSAEDACWLTPEQTTQRIRTPNHGALFSPHCAAMHPGRLVRGLAEAVQRRGVQIHEGSRVQKIRPGVVELEKARVRAKIVIRATEAYTDSIRSFRRRLVPMHSVVIATEPLSSGLWKEIGLSNRETFGDCRRMVIYGQRTADDRMVFGCRGPYLLGSRIRNRPRQTDPSFGRVQKLFHGLFPLLKKTRLSHRWVGVLGVPRDFRPTVGFDAQRGFGFAGGYVGEGVAASNLAARTLADLCLERTTELTNLVWVGADFPSWEPEPLRWMGVNGVRRIAESLDAAELSDRPSSDLSRKIFAAFVKN